MSDVILVTGYYRSGTSALASCLNKLGVYFENSAIPNKFNPLGFYESKLLTDFDYTTFAFHNMRWWHIKPIPTLWWQHETAQERNTELKELLAPITIHSLWGIKHPHLCRLLPFYEHNISSTNKVYNVHISRDPWSSCSSQIAKNGLARSHSLLLWAVYILDAERNTRHLQRSWVLYNDLLNNPIDVFRKIEAETKLNFTNHEEAKELIVQSMNKSRVLQKEGLFPCLIDLVDSIWSALYRSDFSTALWDGFQIECDNIVSFVTDINKSLIPK